MNCQLIAQQMSALGSFDRIDIADNVGNGHVGCGKLFHKTRITVNPIDVGDVAMDGDSLATISRNWLEGIVVHFRSRNDRNLIVEEFSELPDDAALCLSAESQQNDVMFGKNCVNELGNYSLVITYNAAEEPFAGAQFLNEVLAQFVFDGDTLVATGL